MADEPTHDAPELTRSEWLGEPGDVRHILRRITTIAREGIPSVDFASVSVRHASGRLETVAATGPLMFEADGMQYDLNEGPGYDAVTDQDVVYSPDLAHDIRWPTFGPLASELGLLSLLAIRLVHPGRLYMSLNLYSNSPGAFEHHREILVHTFSSHAKEALGQPQDVDTLRDEIAARTTVDQATGILMERDGINSEQALALLTRLAAQQSEPGDLAGTMVRAAERRPPAS